MAFKKEYNTAVIATYKDGTEEQFDSLELAAEKTGLSTRTIKSRAVNEGKTSKDGTTFRWVDSSTKKAYKAKQSKSKGNAWELEFINALKGVGYDGVVSSRSESKRMDDAKIDIVDKKDELPVYIQCKNTANIPNYYKIEAECPLKDKPFVVSWKKAYNDGTRSPEPVVILPANLFLQLIAKK